MAHSTLNTIFTKRGVGGEEATKTVRLLTTPPPPPPTAFVTPRFKGFGKKKEPMVGQK